MKDRRRIYVECDCVETVSVKAPTSGEVQKVESVCGVVWEVSLERIKGIEER